MKAPATCQKPAAHACGEITVASGGFAAKIRQSGRRATDWRPRVRTGAAVRRKISSRGGRRSTRRTPPAVAKDQAEPAHAQLPAHFRLVRRGVDDVRPDGGVDVEPGVAHYRAQGR